MRFIAHTGLPKTGTSAFQEWLVARAADLRPHGIIVPTEIIPPHGNFVDVFDSLKIQGSQRGPKQTELIRLARALMARHDKGDFLVSSEHMEKVVYLPEQIRAFQSGLAEIGATWDMAITVLRNPLDILNSTYAQNVKNGHYPRNFASFVEFRREYRTNEYDRNIAHLRQAGVEVRVMAYRGRSTNVPLTEQLIQLAGLRDQLPADFDFSVPYVNESFGCLAVIAARHVWSLVQHAAPGLPSNLQYQFGTLLREELSKLKDRPFNGYSAEMRRISEDHYAASLDALKPDLSPEDFAMVRTSRSAADPVSPDNWNQLEPGEQQQMREALDRVRARVARSKRLVDYIPKNLDFDTQKVRLADHRPAHRSQNRHEPQIILHVGSHKSGTTAFQAWMKAHSQALADAQVAVPVWLLDRDGNAANLAKALATSNLNLVQEEFQRLTDFSNFARGVRGKTIFFSAEAFETSLSEGGIANVADRFQALQLRKRAAVLIVRNQIDALNSEYSQRRKRMMTVKASDESLDVVFGRGRKNWWVLRQTLQDHGFDPRLGVYRGRDTEMPIARQVMTLAGLADRLGPAMDYEATVANESIGELGCVAARHLSAILDRQGKNVGIPERRWVSNLLITACTEFPDRPYNGFAAETQGRVMAHYRETNLRLAPHLPGGDADVQRLMTSRSADREKSPETWSDLNPGQREIVIAMLEMVSDQLDLTKKRRNILPRAEILDSIPGHDGGRSQPRSAGRIKMNRDDWAHKADRNGADEKPKRAGKPTRSKPAQKAVWTKPAAKKPATPRPSPPVMTGSRAAAVPTTAWVKDPLIERLTLPRIKASLIRRVRALLSRT